jgi:beta-glucanase (GH16 family)
MKSVSFTYGTIIARMKMSGGTGTWPALWLSGASCQSPTYLTAPGFNCAWPSDSSDAAEIDIAEDGGGSSNTVRENLYNSSVSHACNYNVGSDISAGYHTYELDWSPGSLVFKVDGVTTTCGTTKGVPSHPMFLIINTAACTMNACGTLPNNSTLPQTTSVDYVHVSH